MTGESLAALILTGEQPADCIPVDPCEWIGLGVEMWSELPNGEPSQSRDIREEVRIEPYWWMGLVEVPPITVIDLRPDLPTS